MNQSIDSVEAAGESKSSSERQGHGGKGDDHLPIYKKYAHKEGLEKLKKNNRHHVDYFDDMRFPCSTSSMHCPP